MGAAVAVIAGSAYLIYENWDEVGPMFKAVADTIRNAFGSAVEYVSELWDGLVEKFHNLKEFLHFDFGNDNPAQNAFDYSKNIPTYQSASLGNVQTQIQAVQSQANSLSAVISAADTSISQSAAEISNQTAANRDKLQFFIFPAEIKLNLPEISTDEINFKLPAWLSDKF